MKLGAHMTLNSVPFISISSASALTRRPRHRWRAVRLFSHCLVALLLSLCVAGSVAAQTVRGRVEFRNGFPAPGAAVRVVNSRLGPSSSAYTGFDGMYYLYGIPAGDYELQIFINGQLVVRRPIRVFAQPNTDIPPYRLPS